jgi:predicted deacylase
VKYRDYADRIRSYASLADVAEYGVVTEGGQDYPLFRLTVPGSRWLVITSGFHGEEPSGPLTLAESFADLAAYARARDVGLRVYPCINPSGFEDGTRYNRSGEKPNNDFIRYELSPGSWEELPRGQRSFLGWRLLEGGPKETRAVRADLARFAPPHAALDIHQDNYLPMEVTYAYTFGDSAAYRPLMEAASAHATVLKNRQVDEMNVTDEDGFIQYHDGSVTDWYMRQGVPYTAALETTTRTPMRDSHLINLIWVRGFIDLAARGAK